MTLKATLNSLCVKHDGCASGFCKDGACQTPSSVDDACDPSDPSACSSSNKNNSLLCSNLSRTCIPRERARHTPCVYRSDCHYYERCYGLGANKGCRPEKKEGEQCTPVDASLGLSEECGEGLVCSGPAGKTHCLGLCAPDETSKFGCPGQQACFHLDSETNSSRGQRIGKLGVCGFRSSAGNIYPTQSKAMGESVGLGGAIAIFFGCIVFVGIIIMLSLRWINKRKREREEEVQKQVKEVSRSNPPAYEVKATSRISTGAGLGASLGQRPSNEFELPKKTQPPSPLYPSLTPTNANDYPGNAKDPQTDFSEDDQDYHAQDQSGERIDEMEASGKDTHRSFAPPPPSYEESNQKTGRRARTASSKSGSKK